MMGRPRKMPGTHTRNMTKEEQAIQAENKKALATFQPLDFKRVPKELSTREKREWKRLAKDLCNLPLSELDRNSLIAYCTYWGMFTEAKENRDEFGILIIEERKTHTIQKRNPSVDIMATASREIKTIASELGLTINGRLQIISNKNKDESDDENDPFNF